MRIRYFGHSSFLIRNKKATVVTDPFNAKIVGFKFPKVEADIVTVSHEHEDHNQADLVEGNPIVFNFPGEYESKGVRIYGYRTFHDDKKGAERGENIIFKFIIDGVVLLHCGDLGHLPKDSLLEQIEDTDILFVPVGGFFTIGPNQAKKLTELLKPEIIIPMHYNHPKLNQKEFKDLAPVDDFIKLMGKEGLESVPSINIKEDELPDSEVVLLDIKA